MPAGGDAVAGGYAAAGGDAVAVGDAVAEGDAVAGPRDNVMIASGQVNIPSAIVLRIQISARTSQFRTRLSTETVIRSENSSEFTSNKVLEYSAYGCVV